MKFIKFNQYSLAMIIVGVALVLFGAFSASGRTMIKNLFVVKKPATIYNVKISFTNPLDFSYDVTKVTVSNEGAKLKRKNSFSDLILLNQDDIPTGSSIIGFEEQAVRNSGRIEYQLSYNLTHWYYFNGISWVDAKKCVTCGNSASQINELISEFPEISDGFRL